MYVYILTCFLCFVKNSDAGRIAGLEVKRIINEPTAGALCICICICTHKHIYKYSYTSIQIERERERDVYEYIYIHV